MMVWNASLKSTGLGVRRNISIQGGINMPTLEELANEAIKKCKERLKRKQDIEKSDIINRLKEKHGLNRIINHMNKRFSLLADELERIDQEIVELKSKFDNLKCEQNDLARTKRG